jgi:phage protein D
MGKPGNRDVGQDLGPFYILKVEGTKLEADITNFVISVEFESSVDMLDVLKLQISNPGHVFDFGGPDFTTHKVFQPGNEIDLWTGYGQESEAVYVGRAIVDKHLPRYPESGIPVLEIRAYDAAKRMIKESVADITVSKKGKHKRKKTKKDPIGQPFVQKLHSEMVEIIADKYGFKADVYPTSKVDTLFQKKDMTDYQFVKGLAAINSMEFWVDYDIIGKEWVLHWSPNAISAKQRPTYTLSYGREDSGIFHCEAEYGLSEQITDLQVMYWSRAKGEWQRIEESSEKAGPDMTYRKGATPAATQSPKKRSKGPVKAKRQDSDLVNEEIKDADGLRIAAGGHSIDVVPGRKFKDAADAVAFAKRWIRARKEHFITLKGECVGIETLRARQVHKVEGLGKRLSGDYFFTAWRHKLGGGQQYRCEFQAHKVLS